MGGGVRFYANNAKYPVDIGDGIMIQLAPSNERNLSRLWDGSDTHTMTRREFVFAGAAGLFAGCRLAGNAVSGSVPAVRFGMVTDIHYADIDPDAAPVGVTGRRFYR